MTNIDQTRAQLANSIQLGIDMESDDPELEPIVNGITAEQIDWIGDWLAGEGFEAKAQIAKVKAETLREAASEYRSGQLTGIFMGRDDYPREWLLARADRIERGNA